MNVVFDMETSDPDDFLTLCFLGAHPKVNLVAVTITPGTQEQVGLVKWALKNVIGDNDLPIGVFDLNREDGCVSEFHYKIGHSPTKIKVDTSGADVLYNAFTKFPDVTLLTGGPLKNLHQLLLKYPDVKIPRWVAQGGFAGDSLVPPEHRLAKFTGRETCPTFNFNGDPKGALLAFASNNFGKKVLVSKNVCHGTLYDEYFHQRYCDIKDTNRGTKIISSTMGIYLTRHPAGKMLHDPLAACVLLDESICEFTEVEVYRSKGEWGSRKANDTNTFISISVDKQKFEDTFMYQRAI